MQVTHPDTENDVCRKQIRIDLPYSLIKGLKILGKSKRIGVTEIVLDVFREHVYAYRYGQQQQQQPFNDQYYPAYLPSEDTDKRKSFHLMLPGDLFIIRHLVRERMNGYGLGYDLSKYLMEALFHAAKMDKRMLPLIIGTGARFMNDNLTESEIHMEPISQRLQLISDSDLQTFAENVAKFLTENQGYHELLIFLSTFIKLWNKP